jgi:hypothetical protein
MVKQAGRFEAGDQGPNPARERVAQPKPRHQQTNSRPANEQQTGKNLADQDCLAAGLLDGLLSGL